MLTFSEAQKREWLSMFSDVTALYQVFNESRDTHRTKRAEYRCDEVPALPIDFLMDVELKAKRVLPADIYDMFLRLTSLGQLSLLPQPAQILLGRVWKEYGLGVEGSYSKLYFKTKNDQVRNFLKEANNGHDFGDPYGQQLLGNWESDPNSRGGEHADSGRIDEATGETGTANA